MAKGKDAWKIIPQYNEGAFTGYAIKDEKGNFIKNAKGKRVVISDKDTKNWFYDAGEDNCPEGCTIQYKGRQWKVPESILQDQMKARGKAAERLRKMNETGEWVYEDKTDNGIFDGELVWKSNETLAKEAKKALEKAGTNITDTPQNSPISNSRQGDNSR